MARIILALSWRQTIRRLSRSGWTIVGSVFGLLYALGAVFLVLTLSVVGRLFADAEMLRHIVNVVGIFAWIVWLVVAFVIGLQESTGPEQLALLPMTPRDLTTGLLLSGLFGITGIAFALTLVGLWIVSSGSVAALISAIVISPVALLVWFLLTRLVTDGLATRTAGRRVREIVFAVLLLVAVSSGLLIQFVVRIVENMAVNGGVGAALERIGSVLQWLPPVAPVALPGAIAAGEYVTAAGLLGISLVTLGVSWWVWSSMLSARLTAPIQSGGGSVARDGTWIDRLFPANAWGGVSARRVRYFLRDTRHQMNVGSTIVLAVFAIVWVRLVISGDFVAFAAVFAPLLVCLSILTVSQMELAYDGEALAGDLLAGITGRADRLGRAVAIGSIYLPITLITTVLILVFSGEVRMLPAALGINVGGALLAIAVGLAISAVLPGAAPPPGGNPFGKGSSGDMQNLLGTAIGLIACTVLNAAALGFGIASFWHEWAGYVSLAAGLIVGIVALGLSIRVSARWFERRAPENLQHVRKTA